MHVLPQWMNKHLLLPLIGDKRGEPEMTSRLVALVKRVTELYQAGLRACHYAKEFTPRRICPLGRREKLAYECSRSAEPTCEPVDSKILISFTPWWILL
jgi:hypothetical protein